MIKQGHWAESISPSGNKQPNLRTTKNHNALEHGTFEENT